MALIGYARVSTGEQEPALQHDALGSAGCGRVFEDRGVSGARADRPGLNAALAFLREGDVLVVWKLDRLGRSMSHLIATVEALERRGVGFRSLTEAIDTTTPGGRLVFHIFGALGQFERDLIRERTRAGLSAAAARGRKGGRKPVMTPEKLRRAQALLQDKLTVVEVAARLKVGKTALYASLKATEAEDEMMPRSRRLPRQRLCKRLLRNVSSSAGRSGRRLSCCSDISAPKWASAMLPVRSQKGCPGLISARPTRPNSCDGR
jgi:DNA invertase Pin-like site-specific DNA recombinase